MKIAKRRVPVLTHKNWVGDGTKHSVVWGRQTKYFRSLNSAKSFARSKGKSAGKYLYKNSTGRIRAVKV